MPSREEKDRSSISSPQEDLESPFLSEDLFTNETESEAEPHLETLQRESSFQHAFEEGFGPALEPESYEEEVLGKDERTLITDTLKIPNRWICAIDILIDNPKWGGHGEQQLISKSRATGILIGPRYVLTAAHILQKQSIEVNGKQQQVDVRGFTVSPARNGDTNPFGKVTVFGKVTKFTRLAQPYRIRRKVRQGSQIIEIPVERRGDYIDYMLIILEKDLASSTRSSMTGAPGYWGHTPQAVIRWLDPKAIEGKEVVVIGYPGDRCGKDKISGKKKSEKERNIAYCMDRRSDEWASTQWKSLGTLQVEENSTRVFHTADTYEGQSGAPIFLWADGKLNLVGIHTSGSDNQRNKGVLVTERMLKELCSWMNSDAGHQIATIKDDTLIVRPQIKEGKETFDFEALENAADEGEEVLAEETESIPEPHLETLQRESSLRYAFDEGQAVRSEPEDLEEEFDQEHEWVDEGDFSADEAEAQDEAGLSEESIEGPYNEETLNDEGEGGGEAFSEDAESLEEEPIVSEEDWTEAPEEESEYPTEEAEYADEVSSNSRLSAVVGNDQRGWILALDRSAIELLPDTERKQFLNQVNWSLVEFPGNGPKNPECEANWRLADELFNAMAVVAPERRVPRLIRFHVPVVVNVPGQPDHKLFAEACDAFVRMRNAAAVDGVKLVITSSWRSAKKQASLHRRQSNVKAVARRKSAHMYGLAIDLRMRVADLNVVEMNTRTAEKMANLVRMYRSPVYKWMALRGRKFGWYPYRREPWHWEYNPPGFKERFESAAPASTAGFTGLTTPATRGLKYRDQIEHWTPGTQSPQKKEVIYVRGATWRENGVPMTIHPKIPWWYAHPRGARSSTVLSLFDYHPWYLSYKTPWNERGTTSTLRKHRRWNNWDGALPPNQKPDEEFEITSILDLYNYIKSGRGAEHRAPGSVQELHFFTHGFEGGPIVTATDETEVFRDNRPYERDPADTDARLKDFRIANVLGGIEGQKFKRAFSSSALVKLWGCHYNQDYRDMIRQYFRTKTRKTEIKNQYQRDIETNTYQFALHRTLGLPVYAAPLGWGTSSRQPFGLHGKDAKKVIEEKKVKYRGKWPPDKGDMWWRTSHVFRQDGGYEFYTTVLGAKLDILDYVAYTEAIIK